MDFLLPKLSSTMETATVGRWFKKAGEAIRMGEPLVELETDKATLEVESPVDATVAEIVAETGAVLEIGAVLARLNAEGDAAASPSPTPVPPHPAAAVAPPQPAPLPAPAPSAVSAPPPAPPRPVVSASAAPRILASPLARRLAETHGIELAGLSGTGPNGRVRKRDVMTLLGARSAATAPSRPQMARAAAAQPAPKGPVEPLSPMRAGIAASVTLSRQSIPSFVLDRWIDTSALERARLVLGADIEQLAATKPTFTDFLLQAMADCLRQTPVLLDRYVEQNGKPARARGSSIDIGLVVAVADGVMIPVVRDLAGKPLSAIAAARHAAVQRARSGRLSQADTEPASISLSNIGRSGADRFEAIIGPGQTGILAVGREHEKIVPRAGAIAISRGVNVTLAADHRLIDGLTGADFLGLLADRMERGPWSAT